MTCTPENVRVLVPHSQFVPVHPVKRCNPCDLMDRAFAKMHCEMVRRLVYQSIRSIENVVFQNAETAETRQLKLNASTADFTVLLSIFLCLLNVDPGLKEAVMLSATPANKHKLAGMLQHLRHTLVVDFFTDEGVSTGCFNHACEDLYIVS